MKRFHVHAHVNDLKASIAFYSKLFATTRGKPAGAAVMPGSPCC